MKKLLTIVLLTISIAASAQQFRYGFYVSPVKNMWVVEDPGNAPFGPSFGFQYGFLFDQTFGAKEHIALTAGFTMDYTQGGMELINVQQGEKEKNWMVRAQYVELPIALRYRTNQMNKLTFYGQAGATFGKCLRAPGDYTENGLRFDSDINYLLNENTVNVYQPFNMSIDLGIGSEIALTETASILIGIYFKNGLSDIYDDGNKKYDVKLRQFGLSVGGLF